MATALLSCVLLLGVGDVMRPLLLYENVLEGATLTASSTASGYDVDSVKTRVPADRWTSNSGSTHTITAELAEAVLPTAFAITRHDLAGNTEIIRASDDFARSDEAPLADPPWERTGTSGDVGVLDLVSGVLTNSGHSAQGSTDIRRYEHEDVTLSSEGYGFAEVKVRYSAVGLTTRAQAGLVMHRGSGAGKSVTLLLRPQSNLHPAFGHTAELRLYIGEPTDGGFFLHETVDLDEINAAQWYTLRMEIRDGNFRALLDGVEVISEAPDAMWWPYSPGNSRAGVESQFDDPSVQVVEFDDFKAGAVPATVGDTFGRVTLRGGSDGVSWPYERTFELADMATFIGAFDDAASYAWWQFEFLANESSVMIGSLALGRRLDFTESMAQGFDPTMLRLEAHQNRSNSGEYLGTVVRYPTQRVGLRFGPAGLSTTDFFNVTGTPSWRDFLTSTWSRGRAFWFAWDLTQRSEDMWFAWPGDKPSTSSPFITAIRRGWKTTWDVLVERVGT